MASHAMVLPEVNSKTLNRRASRSAILWSVKRANYMGFVLPRLERMIRVLDESIKTLSSPVKIVVGQGDKAHVIEVMDYASQAKIASALLSAMEQERQLLGFPSPGKRRDEGQAGEMRSASAPAVLDVQAVQPASQPGGQAADASQAGNASAPAGPVNEPSQAEPSLAVSPEPVQR